VQALARWGSPAGHDSCKDAVPIDLRSERALSQSSTLYQPDAAPDRQARGTAAAPREDRPRFAWALTGSGHFLEESLALAASLPDVDLFLSRAAEEVLAIYDISLDALKARFRVFRDKSASATPVGMLYGHRYHTVVVAPASSNTVAKCAAGISDTLPTNVFAQAGKLRIPELVFACDTEPMVVTKGPESWLTLHPRNIELENVERLRRIDHCRVVCSIGELRAALDQRLQALSLTWNTSSS